MGLTSAFSIANSGLANLTAQFAVLSQNIANASTPGYAAEIGTQKSVAHGDLLMGVRTLPAGRQVDLALQASARQQNAAVVSSQVTQGALQAIDAVLGTPGSGNDIGSLLGGLHDTFTTLLTNPANQAQHSAVVNAASMLAAGIRQVSNAYTAQRQAAQDDLQSAVSQLNTTLTNIGGLSRQIMVLKQQGLGTADLENQRDAEVQTLSGLLQVNTAEQPNGDLSLFTPSGISLPTTAAAGAFGIGSASVDPSTSYANGLLPGVTLNGTDVTGQLAGGRIGADLALRDHTLPAGQAELDELAYHLSARFAAQGLALFTDPGGNVPASGGSATQSGYVGFAAEIQVNPAVTARPSLVRDGTDAISDDPNGASAFTPNSASGPVGFTALVSRILTYTFGNQAQSGVPQPGMATTGLGPDGTIDAPFGAAGATLNDYATSLVSAQAQQSGTVANDLTSQEALQSGLNARIASTSGVNMDAEMSRMLTLQKAYSMNARVISAVQQAFNQLLQAVS